MTPRLPTAGLALLASLSLGACYNPRTPERLGGGGRIGFEESERCEEVGQNRPFGQRFERFGQLVVDGVEDQREDWDRRMDWLSRDAQAYAHQTAREVRLTGEFLKQAPMAPIVDAGLHHDSLAQEFQSTWARAKRDARCFWTRTWNVIKWFE